MRVGRTGSAERSPLPNGLRHGWTGIPLGIDANLGRRNLREGLRHVIDPMIVDGQVLEGVAPGIRAAPLEEITYGPDGQLLSRGFMGYLIPTAGEVPKVEINHLVTPSRVHELGTKGIGEGGTIDSTAVANANADALSVPDRALPFTPDRVPSLIRAK